MAQVRIKIPLQTILLKTRILVIPNTETFIFPQAYHRDIIILQKCIQFGKI